MDSVKGSVTGEREIRMNRKSVKDFQSSENILHDTVIEISHVLLVPTYAYTLPLSNISHQSGIFITINRPILAHHYYPKSTHGLY